MSPMLHSAEPLLVHILNCFLGYLLPPLSAISDLIWSNAKIRKYFSYPSSIYSTVGCYVCFTASMYIHLANCNLNQTEGRGARKIQVK